MINGGERGRSAHDANIPANRPSPPVLRNGGSMKRAGVRMVQHRDIALDQPPDQGERNEECECGGGDKCKRRTGYHAEL